MSTAATTLAGLRRQLNKACDQAGGTARWAHQHGLSPFHVLDVLKGARAPSAGLLEGLGLQAETRYVRRPAKKPPPHDRTGRHHNRPR